MSLRCLASGIRPRGMLSADGFGRRLDESPVLLASYLAAIIGGKHVVERTWYLCCRIHLFGKLCEAFRLRAPRMRPSTSPEPLGYLSQTQVAGFQRGDEVVDPASRH